MRVMWWMWVLAACGSSDPASPDAPRTFDAQAPDAVACSDPGVQGCACAPVSPGMGGSFPIASIKKLVGDPLRCAIYGLTDDQVVVFDTRSKTEVARIPLIAPASDLDISGDGSIVVVSHPAHAISIIDLEQRAVSMVWPVREDAERVEVTSSRIAYYTNLDEWSTIHSVDLATGNDIPLNPPFPQNVAGYQVDMELSSDDSLLYVADSALSSGDMTAYQVSGEDLVLIEQTHWSNGRGFNGPDRALLVSRGGHAFYAQHQWDIDDLDFVTGGTAEVILAEDDSGRIAIGATHVWDARIVYPIRDLAPISAAAFTAADQELWTYGEGAIHYISTAELIGDATLGARELDPLPLAQYHLDQLIHDPARPALYARDRQRNAVVIIDTATLLPTREIRVGTEPTDLVMDSGGDTLYVGHGDMEAIGRIDLQTSTFERFVPTPRQAYELESVSPGRVVFVDLDYNDPILFNVDTGVVRAQVVVSLTRVALTVAGTTLYVGESTSTFSRLIAYSIGTSSLTEVDRASMTFDQPPRILVASMGDVFYASSAILGSDLDMVRYTVTEPIRAVSPDGRVALSEGYVWDRATGANIGSLPVVATVQAIDPGSHRAYLSTGTGVVTVELDGYVP